jgi:hypothetical protein
MGLMENLGIILLPTLFFGISIALIYRIWFRSKGPQGSLSCPQCGGSGHTWRGVCSVCEGKGWRYP